MSGTSSSEDCPCCGSKNSLTTAYDWRPHQTVSGTCLVCGYSYWTELGFSDRECLDELRADFEFETVKITDEMKKQIIEYCESYRIRMECKEV